MVWLKLSIAFAIALLFHASVNIAQDLQEFKVSPAVLAKPNMYQLARGDLAYFFHDRPRVAIVNRNSVRICNLEDGREVKRIPIEVEGIFEGGLSSNDQMLVFRSSLQGKAKVVCVDLAIGEVINEVSINNSALTSGGMGVSGDGTKFGIGTFDGKVSIYSVLDGSEVGSFQDEKGYVTGIAFGEVTDKIATLFNDGKLIVRDKPTGKVIYRESLQHQDFSPVLRFINKDEFVEIRTYRQTWESLGAEPSDDIVEFRKLASKNFQIVSSPKYYATHINNGRLDGNEIVCFDRESRKKIYSTEFSSGVFRMKELSSDGRFLRFLDYSNSTQIIDLSKEDALPSTPADMAGLEFLPGENQVIFGSPYYAVRKSKEDVEHKIYPNWPFIQHMRVDLETKQIFFLPYNSGTVLRTRFETPLKFEELKLGRISKVLKLTGMALRNLDFRSIGDEQIIVLQGIKRSAFVRSIAEGHVIVARVNLAKGEVIKSATFKFGELGKEQNYQNANDSSVIGQFLGPTKHPEVNSVTAAILTEDLVSVSFNSTLNFIDLKESKIVDAKEQDRQLKVLTYLPSTNSVLLTDLGGTGLYEYEIDKKNMSIRNELNQGPFLRAELVDDSLLVLTSPSGIVFADPQSRKQLDFVKGNVAFTKVAPDKQHLAIAGSDGSLEIVRIEELRKKPEWKVKAD